DILKINKFSANLMFLEPPIIFLSNFRLFIFHLLLAERKAHLAAKPHGFRCQVQRQVGQIL
ncbi:MAG: hypothetical protein KAU41_03255, partial [Deltaproteobacteria bacterium]|nr:hypothetical protein [Deltaproteobacteria bacterium]